ncbi:S1C family serine protease [Mycobacterium haemophilum]|uniref:S1C family serine protease n=1 Tax=Mycobacterium haemophilum TaxID=29311 RepID=UPI0009E44CA3|nr:trypsin-like peptidase domain-containing protein [Mycobacterium haemophilum]
MAYRVTYQLYARASTKPETGSVPTVLPPEQAATAVDVLRQSIFRNWKLFAGTLAVAAISGISAATAVLATDPFGYERAGSGTSATWPVAELPSSSLERAAAKAVPSVVKLETNTGRQSEEGSGIVLTADGLILTSSHVVSGFDASPDADAPPKRVATFADGRTASFSVVGTDLTTDVAVVRAQGISGLTPITLGSSAKLRVGQSVVAVGAPLGLESTVTTGIISALHRPILTPPIDVTGHRTALDTIQTDAAINPGSSGGALIDSNGDLVGLNSLIWTTGGGFLLGPSGSIGLGFAIPVDQAKRIVGELVATGTASHAYLGVRLTRDRDTHGAKIVEVKSGSPAATAGLAPGTVVTRMDDRAIVSAEALVAVVLSKTPGDTVVLTYTDTAGTTRTAPVTLASDRVAGNGAQGLLDG